MSRGRFITIEGGEGAGKSTQIGRLAISLRRHGIDVVETREPGGAPGALDIRKLLVEGATDRWDAISELLLHSAARHDHVTRTIDPALTRGAWVVCDRYADSTMAYQGHGHGLSREMIDNVTRIAVGSCWPDLTLILDAPVAVGLQRAQQRGGGAEDRYERMGVAFHERLRQGFHEIARRDPKRCRLIDATGTPDAVASAIWLAVQEPFGLT